MVNPRGKAGPRRARAGDRRARSRGRGASHRPERPPACTRGRPGDVVDMLSGPSTAYFCIHNCSSDWQLLTWYRKHITNEAFDVCLNQECCQKYLTIDGVVAQMAERSLSMREVRGSIPCDSTFAFFSSRGSLFRPCRGPRRRRIRTKRVVRSTSSLRSRGRNSCRCITLLLLCS